MSEGDAKPRNYITLKGALALQEELRQLQKIERPKIVEVVSWAAGNGDRSENGDYIYGKKRLREIDKRAGYIQRQLASSTVVDPKQQQGLDRVFFGATVTYVNEENVEATHTIVGVDEANLAQGSISYHAPLAKALMKKQVGDEVKVRTPSGVETIEILEITYLTERP